MLLEGQNLLLLQHPSKLAWDYTRYGASRLCRISQYGRSE